MSVEVVLQLFDFSGFEVLIANLERPFAVTSTQFEKRHVVFIS